MMPLFALPLPSYNTRSPSDSHSRASKKRKLAPIDAETTDDDKVTHNPPPSPHRTTRSQSQVSLAASTNPLSLGKNEIEQYRLAGLELDQELPSKTIPEFPHRGLPREPFFEDAAAVRSGHGEDEEESGGEKEEGRGPRGSMLRMRHLGVLTGILHRCLLEGDMVRAKRAWSMLLRVEVNGKGPDIRSTGYWGIGAEVLIRGEDQPATRPKPRRSEGDEAGQSDGEEEEKNENIGIKEERGGEQRWGTVAGLEKAREYYERLILQHPYRHQFPNSVNSLDFYPAMFGCEIYGIQIAHNEELRLIAVDQTRLEDSSDVLSEDEGAALEDEEDDYFTRSQRRDARKAARIQEASWKRRDEARMAALLAAEKLAAKMDALMGSLPYAVSAAFQRLRGMVALWVGDLNVPELPMMKRRKAENESDDDEEGKEQWFSRQEITEKRFVERQRKAEHERGREKRKLEIARARKSFEAVKRAGGVIEDEMAMLPLEEDDGVSLEEETWEV